ncbi:hypothetical protein [Xenorhabdus bovienii]|uniref:hypothetical protein n=1 Tax=Xenorhabdus bovienii TaxID=40576 RepID=UPI0023B2530E|nr:hypothetical protein [Xenorhabdus bovienii]MDE9541980.1 hypothetical protein [Xenorhabdus bovienii]
MAAHDRIIIKVKPAANKGITPCVKITEPYNELSITHSHDNDELCHIKSGTMEFLNDFEKSIILKSGEKIIIEHNRLHGILIKPEFCNYEIYTIGDLTKWEYNKETFNIKRCISNLSSSYRKI